MVLDDTSQFGELLTNSINRSIEFNLKNITNVVNAIWHTPPDDDYILCLARIGNDMVVKFFSLANHNVILKTFNLTGSIMSNPFVSTHLEKPDFKLTNKNNGKTGRISWVSAAVP